MKKNHSAPARPVIAPEITKAVSLTGMARTPRLAARSSSSLIARS